MNGILVGYDGSGHSLRALEWAAHEAVIRREPLTVLSICPAGPSRWVRDPESPCLEDTLAGTKEQAGKTFAQACPELPRPVLSIRAVTGAPAEELLNASADADMVVVGSRGAGGFARLRLGSVSSHITQHAHCPVVVVPDDDI